MLRNLSSLIAITAFLLSATATFAAPVHGKAARGASLARLWFLARLPFTRADRMGTGAESRAGLLVWRPGLLSRALERRRLRPVLDPDPDRQCMELRSIVDRPNRDSAPLSLSQRNGLS